MKEPLLERHLVAACSATSLACSLQGWEILRQMGADYFFVLYGGNVNYPPDDMNKFSWIIKIASKEYPEIKEDLIYSLDNMGQYFRRGAAGEGRSGMGSAA